MKLKISTIVFASLVLTCAFTSCKDDRDDKFVLDKPDLEILVLSFNNQLIAFNSSNVSTPLRAAVNIAGMQAAAGNNPAEQVLAIDYRPATGQLYGITNYSRMFIINPLSGVTNLIGTISPALSGNIAAFDFNPTVDRVRVITSTGQNLRVNPETAAATEDGAINGPAGAVVSASAYSNNVSGATTTALFNIDVVAQKLYRQEPPNNGTLVEIGSLNLPASSGNAGMDISHTGVALAVIKNGGNAALYEINLETGAARSLGSIANNSTSASSYTGIAIVPPPVAYATDAAGNLITFNPTNTTTVAPVSKPITGLEAGEKIWGIDFRPMNGQLFGLGSTNRIYTINTATAAATPVSAVPFTPALAGAFYAFDFNPQVDLIRVVSNSGQSLRISPATGLVVGVDGSVAAPAEITAAAYSNNFRDATSTVLYVVDSGLDKLYTQATVTGALTSVGNATNRLGINVDAVNGFDIGGATGTAYGIFTVNTTVGADVVTTRRIYSINLTTGAATAVADFPVTVHGFALGLGF